MLDKHIDATILPLRKGLLLYKPERVTLGRGQRSGVPLGAEEVVPRHSLLSTTCQAGRAACLVTFGVWPSSKTFGVWLSSKIVRHSDRSGMRSNKCAVRNVYMATSLSSKNCCPRQSSSQHLEHPTSSSFICTLRGTVNTLSQLTQTSRLTTPTFPTPLWTSPRRVWRLSPGFVPHCEPPFPHRPRVPPSTPTPRMDPSPYPPWQGLAATPCVWYGASGDEFDVVAARATHDILGCLDRGVYPDSPGLYYAHLGWLVRRYDELVVNGRDNLTSLIRWPERIPRNFIRIIRYVPGGVKYAFNQKTLVCRAFVTPLPPACVTRLASLLQRQRQPSSIP